MTNIQFSYRFDAIIRENITCCTSGMCAMTSMVFLADSDLADFLLLPRPMEKHLRSESTHLQLNLFSSALLLTVSRVDVWKLGSLNLSFRQISSRIVQGCRLWHSSLRKAIRTKV